MTPAALDAMLQALPDPAWLVEAKALQVVGVNRAASRLLGLDARSMQGRKAPSLCVSPEDLSFWAEAAVNPRAQIHSETIILDGTGVAHWVSRSVMPVAVGDAPAHFLVCLRDQTAKRRAEQARETLLSELNATLESTSDGILVTDLAGRIRSFNKRFAVLWSLPDNLLLERDDIVLWKALGSRLADADSLNKRLQTLLAAPLSQSGEVLRLANGRVLEMVSRPQLTRGEPIGRVFSFRDLSDMFAASQRIEELGRSDSLTGLPNRRALAAQVASAQLQSRRDGSGFALLHIDVDRFKQINDTLGHTYGDRVLREVADRLSEGLGAADFLARPGGNEFALLLAGGDARSAEAAAQRVQLQMARPFSFDSLNFTVTCSTGIALFPGDGASADELISSAERALHWVKESGRAGYRFHAPRPEVDLLSRMRLDHAMRQGLTQGHFRLHYQPQLDLASGRVIGAEALIRWRDPMRGDISPADFIPLAEESGFITVIGDWVLRQALAQVALWRSQGLHVPVAVNVSALQFQRSNFVESVAQALRDTGVPAELIELELTESVLVSDAQESLRRMHALAALGVKLSIDDFGTGYSSLAYLKRFPIQRLKIDRSFIKGLPSDPSDVGIANAIIQMGRALELQVIAEGVEHEAQRLFLQRAGCHEYQGFLFAPALAVQDFEQRVWQLGVQGADVGFLSFDQPAPRRA
jgi:diguanylate cyclase (GGDEF)-like protein/PAS domain S-box-containing protein